MICWVRKSRYVEAPVTHQQRKFYALRVCVKLHLKIPDKVIQHNCRFDIAAYHWPLPILVWRRRASSMLNHIEAKILDNKQPLGSFPPSNLFLHNSNNYGRLISHILDPLLVRNLTSFVGGPVATKKECKFCPW